MFLKRIELQGFKSFADKTTIYFEHEMTGIVGPNGCGKSNINDAIRWVLGEQSVKSLRGNTMSDVIFSGSKTKKSVNIAKVSLIFDNHLRHFDLDFDEIEITRCLHRINNENEYFINKTPCRLKDITNLVMDSGLGKDSLSIISQGSISAFAEAKPLERRAIFEEAASVAKYKKRKQDSLSKLERTNDNLTRINDIVHELEKQVEPLKKQADKAKIFLTKEQRLKEIEVSVIVDNIQQFQNRKTTLELQISEIVINYQQNEQLLEEKEVVLANQKQAMYKLDYEINQLQEDLVRCLNKIKQLETQKIEIDEKRKYQKSNANNQQRKQLLFEELHEITYEYNNRKAREEVLKQKLAVNKDEIKNIQDQLDLVVNAFNKQKLLLQKTQNEIQLTTRLIEQPYLSQIGVKNIMEAKHLIGIHDTVSKSFIAKDDYEKAIQSALNSIMYHIFVDDSNAGKNAIKYLKKNHAGRATFIPLDTLFVRRIHKEHEVIAQSVTGYLGVASDFVSCDAKYEQAKLSLLGNILIATDIDEANHLAKLLKNQYKIITLDGDVIHRGGSMSGGSFKQNASIFSLQKTKEHLLEQESKIISICDKYKIEQQKIHFQKQTLDQENLKLQLDIAQLTPIIVNMEHKKEKLTLEYNQIQDDGVIVEDYDDTLIKDLSTMQQQQDELNSLLQSKRTLRFELGEQSEAAELANRGLRRELASQNAEKQKLELEYVKCTTQLENELDILRNQYAMTYEYAQTQIVDIDIQSARDEVRQLKNDIQKLGHVNLDAPSQYEEVYARYHSLTSQITELNLAKDDVLKAIEELDSMMKIQFSDMFDKINEQLNIVFKSLFPSGQATLILSDEQDLLNTGIDIEVSFPGKTLKNIRLFSGGEKALVAICVLFAIIRARTMPLCIFDEVEAALDQVNVDKFANYIATLKNETQFIVVTHRPGTMVKCDSLFGVTMQQSGVSNILSVKMEDALNMVKEKN